MAAVSSFDVVSKVDRQEVDNALNQAAKEIANRYDVRGVGASIEWADEAIVMSANAPERVLAILDVLQSKLFRRGVSLQALDIGGGGPARAGQDCRLGGALTEGGNTANARKITKLIRADGPGGGKTQITGDEVRVSSKSRDDLQTVIARLKWADEIDAA